MNEVYYHVKALAVDLLFAGPVKVELLERVFLVANQNKAARAVVDHDRVTVIDDVQRRRLVVEMDRRQGSFLRIADVNGGLVVSSLARCELRFQITPMARSTLPVVTPNVLRLMFLRTAAHRQSQRGQHDDPSRPVFVHVQAPK